MPFCIRKGRIRRLILEEGRIRRWEIRFKRLGIVLETGRNSTKDKKEVWGLLLRRGNVCGDSERERERKNDDNK